MEQVTKIWKQQVSQNPIENIVLEINLGNRIDKNCISYELTGSKFNEILADIALLKIWSEWKSGYSTKYFLNDMVLIVDEQGHQRVSINKTIYDTYMELPDKIINNHELCGSKFLQNLPHITDIRVHKDDTKPKDKEPDEIEDDNNKSNDLQQTIEIERTFSHLHVKCCRKIPI